MPARTPCMCDILLAQPHRLQPSTLTKMRGSADAPPASSRQDLATHRSRCHAPTSATCPDGQIYDVATPVSMGAERMFFLPPGPCHAARKRIADERRRRTTRRSTSMDRPCRPRSVETVSTHPSNAMGMSLHRDDALRPRRWFSAHSGFQRRFSDRLDLDLYPDA